MTLEFRTLPAWPRTPTKNRRESPFRAHYQDTLDLLMKELHARRARTVAILAAFEAQDIRRDGFPRTSATPKHPGIIVFLTTEKGEHLSFPCDTFLDWKDNLRAIALTLESLRKIDRYGVTRNDEQYKGFSALPPQSPAFESALEATRFILTLAVGQPSFADLHKAWQDPANLLIYYKKAAAKAHPDGGGSHELFLRLQEAKRVTDEFHQKRGGT